MPASRCRSRRSTGCTNICGTMIMTAWSENESIVQLSVRRSRMHRITQSTAMNRFFLLSRMKRNISQTSSLLKYFNLLFSINSPFFKTVIKLLKIILYITARKRYSLDNIFSKYITEELILV